MRMGTDKEKKKNWITKVLLIFFLCVFIFAGFRLFQILKEYGKATSEYQNLSENYVQETGETVQDSEEETEETQTETEYPDWNIDFVSLEQLNTDIIGWLYIPACEISYPIVQTEDNTYYLDKTFTKQTNSSGAVFMDYENSADFSDWNTFIYAHNMKNGSMFGKLKVLYRDKGIRAQYPYFYIFLPDNSIEKYQIISYYITTDESDSYRFVQSEEEYQAYLNEISRKSIESISTETEEESKMVSLSTCSGASGGDQRFLVHGICIATYER